MHTKSITSEMFFCVCVCWSNLIHSHLYVCSASLKELCSFIPSLTLEYGKKKLLYWKKSGKSFAVWTQKSVQTLCYVKIFCNEGRSVSAHKCISVSLHCYFACYSLPILFICILASLSLPDFSIHSILRHLLRD